MVPGRRLVLVALASLVCAVILPVSASPVAASAPSLPSGCVQVVGTGHVTCTLAYTGDTQTFTVPPGVFAVGLVAVGGHGGTVHQGSRTTPGGRGADVSGIFPVQGGDALTVTVGGDAPSSTGAFGYGHGGSSSDTSLGAGGGGGTAVADGNTLLLVAGAGGGGAVSDGRCPGPGAGGDAGNDGGSSVPCGRSQIAYGGLAGAAPTQDGGDSVPAVSAGGGGGGGGYHGGDGGEDSPLLAPNLCCLSAGGGGGGTNYADASGDQLQMGGLSGRTPGTGGLVQISYQPQGPTTQLGLSPDPGSVNAGSEQGYSVTGYNAEGAVVSDLSGYARLSISPDGTCSDTGCTPAATGPHTVTAVYASLSTTASLDATRAPVFTSPGGVRFTRLRSGSATVRATGVPEPRIARHGLPHLPAGLALTNNGDGTATITGTPTGRPTTRQVTLTATSAAGRATQVLTVVVAPLPGVCANRFVGTTGHDRLRGTRAGDRLVGLAGHDTLPGYAGADCISGGAGHDVLFGDRGADRIRGGSGNDVLVGGPGLDAVRGGPGDDTIRVADGRRDLVDCGRGHDTVVADPQDVLHGCESITIR